MPAQDEPNPLTGLRPTCALCTQVGGHLVWKDEDWRVIRADEAGFPAFYRVVHQRHVAEFSGLSAAGRQRCMDLVTAVEQVLIDRLAPTKVNLAALGNVVAHLHWHVIARFEWDSHFPQPVWAAALRVPEPAPLQRLPLSLAALDAAVAQALQAA